VLSRSHAPTLPIKINVVAEKANNSIESITQYLRFAKNNNLEISVFREGFFRVAAQLGIEIKIPPSESADWWDLTYFNSMLVEEKPRKKKYLVNSVYVSLSTTSTDEQSYDAIWVTPTGAAYCNMFHETPAVSLLEAIHERNRKVLESCIKSLLDEAEISRLLTQAKKYCQAQEVHELEDQLVQIVQWRTVNLPLAKTLV
jgi:hypothetical protein